MKLSDFDDRKSAADALELLVARFNGNRTPYPRDRSVPALFAEQAAARPQAVAVIADDSAYSYAELAAAANRFARLLLANGLQPEDRVAVMIDDAFASTAAILGTLVAGGAYVPIDARTPFDRIRYMLDDTGARFLAAQKRDLRVVNRLQWECPALDIVFCCDSRDIAHEPEAVGELMREDYWEQVASNASDDIAAGSWYSSFTGEPLSREVMDGYGDNVLTKLRPHLGPTTRLLEIGCGSGISMRRLAPLVASYCATDLSGAMVDWSRQEAERAGLGQVVLHQLAAHDIDSVDGQGFDVVVMNSVIRCFSGYHYLREVLRKTVATMADRGVLFLGNLLDLDSKQRFVDALTGFRAQHPEHSPRAMVNVSEELFVPAAWLDDLRHDLPEIVSIERSAMLGDVASELSDYGYDAILHIDKRHPAAPAQPRRKRQYDLAALERHAPTPLVDTTGPQSLAYVIYTSGTSGRPKGVMVDHRPIVRLVKDTDYVRLGPEVRILQTGSPAFDASTFEIWGALLNGGALCRPPERSILDPNALARLIAEHGITTMFMTTGLFHQHADSGVDLFAGLKELLVGGERLSLPHANRVRERYPDLLLSNIYGPTENTTFTSSHRIEHTYTTEIPIGRPIANSQVLILDAEGALAPVGVAGEICTAGDGLARGYLGDPELTRAKFVAHPSAPDQRIYRSGDAGLWRADGSIEYLGRLDDQIKIRGFRIEPAEIEGCILRDATILQARVVGRIPAAGEAHELVAYVVAQGPAGDGRMAALQQRLKSLLPDYMVPAHFVALDRMPLTTSGKVDLKALPDPRGLPSQGATVAFDAPATEVEQQIAAIFAEVLDRAPIGANDDFFDSGGHSLKVMKVVASVERRLGVVLTPRTVFVKPTVRGLAEHVVDCSRFGVAAIDDAMVPLNRADGPPLFAFPPGTGDALGFVQLAELLPARFYGFNFIEAASRLSDYADLVQSVDASGPCLLLGYSSGGNLAFQVARTLEQRGCRIAAIVMIDSARQLRPTPLDADAIDRASAAFLADASVQPYLASPVLRERARRLTSASLRQVGRIVDDGVVSADLHVIYSEGAVTELHAEDGTLLLSQSRWADATTGRLRVYAGFGEHNRILWPPFLQRNAEVIRSILDRVPARAAGLPPIGRI